MIPEKMVETQNDGANRWSKKIKIGLDTIPACDIQTFRHFATVKTSLCYAG